MSRQGVREILAQIRTRIALSGARIKLPPRMMRIARMPSGPKPRRRRANQSFAATFSLLRSRAFGMFAGDCRAAVSRCPTQISRTEPMQLAAVVACGNARNSRDHVGNDNREADLRQAEICLTIIVPYMVSTISSVAARNDRS